MSQSPSVQAVHRNKTKKLHSQMIPLPRSLPTSASVVVPKRPSGRPKKTPIATPTNVIGGTAKPVRPRKAKCATSIDNWSGNGMGSEHEEARALSSHKSDDYMTEDPSCDEMMEEDELSMSDMTLELTQRRRSLRIEAGLIPNWNVAQPIRSTLSESSSRDAAAEEEHNSTLDVIVVDVNEVATELKVAPQMETRDEMTIDSVLERDGAEANTEEASEILDLSTARTEIRSLRDNEQQLLTELQLERAANVRLRASLGRRGVTCILILICGFWWTHG